MPPRFSGMKIPISPNSLIFFSGSTGNRWSRSNFAACGFSSRVAKSLQVFCSIKCVSLKSSYLFATFVSDLQYRFSPRDRNAVTQNLQSILNTKGDVSRETREVFLNFGRYLAEFFKDNFLSKEFIRSHVQVSNIDRIDQALKGGKGAIIITAHIGNWELGALTLGEFGYRLMVLALPHKERPVNDLFNTQRSKKGITVVPTSVSIRRLIETLRENKIIALAADRDFGNNGEVMPFLRKKVLIPKGAAIFALKTGAPIIPVFLIRKDEGRFNLMVEEPIYPAKQFKGEIPQGELVNLMKIYLKVIEDKIYQYPTQWLMFRRYWV